MRFEVSNTVISNIKNYSETIRKQLFGELFLLRMRCVSIDAAKGIFYKLT